MQKHLDKKWWQDRVVYQIYPRSFQDSNGDGIGDIQGIIRRLDYLEELGIGAIWLSPVCRSPQDDCGYDISEYQDIDPMFGSLDDMECLIREAKKRDIRILVDLVLNHSSDEHPWFVEAKKSKENPYHDYYVWRDGVAGEAPNDMKACFGGSAWEWVPELGQYYFHQFSVKQPDLNWDNPKVRQEIYEMIYWWMEKGVGGFRMDVIDQIAKVPELKITNNGPRLHEFLQEMSRETFQKGDLLTVGEAWGANTDLAKLYSNPDGSEFSMVFQFEHIGLDQQEGKEKWDLAPFSFLKLKEIMNKWQKELYDCGWNSLFWNNHDLPRIVSRWGNEKEYREKCAKMMATLLHGMQGTPYIYQGEELGMTNAEYEISEYRDIETLNMYKERIAAGYPVEEVLHSIHVKGRDNARTPMQWDDSEHAGFTTGTPWIKVNPNYPEINAAAQVGKEESVFTYYKTLVRLRRQYEVFVDGKFEMLFPEHPEVMVYTRINENTEMVVICNFFGNKISNPVKKDWGEYHLLLTNDRENGDADVLTPYEARIYIRCGIDTCH